MPPPGMSVSPFFVRAHGMERVDPAATPITRFLPLEERTVAFRRLNQSPVAAASTPVLDPPAQEALLSPMPAALGKPSFTVTGGAVFRPLETWVARPQDDKLDAKAVLCTRGGLQITLPIAASAAGATLFPTSPSELGATFAYFDSDGNRQEIPFTAVVLSLDPPQLKLMLQFGPKQDGARAYAAVLSAITMTAGKATVTVHYVVHCAVQDPASAPGNVLVLTPITDLHPVFGRTVVDRRLMFRPEALTLAHELTTTGTFIPPPPAPPPPGPPAPRAVNVPRSFDLGLLFDRARSPDVFPDRPPDGPANVWSSWRPSQTAAQAVYYRSTSSPAVWEYLPSSYQLGFVPDEKLAPIAVDNYLDDQGAYRVRARIAALPVIDPAVREGLREHIIREDLAGKLPWIGLEPAAGMKAAIVDRSLAPQSGGNFLPADVRVVADDLEQPDRRLLFHFDMGAYSYGLFCALLSGGLSGSISLVDALNERAAPLPGVPLRLDLSMPTSSPPTITAVDAQHVTLASQIGYSTRVDKLLACSVTTGGQPGLVIDAERHEDILGGAVVVEPGGSKDIALPAFRIADADLLTFAFGEVRVVDAGTSAEWLDRVSRDPSVQKHEYKWHLAFAGSGMDAAVAGTLAVQVSVFRLGETAPRREWTIAPGAAGGDLAVPLTLADLKDDTGAPARFAVEWFNRYGDGSSGLPQRTTLDLQTREVTAFLLRETADSLYDVADADGEHAQRGLTPADARAAIATRRLHDTDWILSVPKRAPADAGTATGTGATIPTTGGGTATSVGAGTAVNVILDLVAPLLKSSAMERVLLALSGADDGAPTSSFVIDASTPAPLLWQAPAGVPPLKWRATYVFARGSVVTAGKESNALLILEPPAPPA